MSLTDFADRHQRKAQRRRRRRPRRDIGRPRGPRQSSFKLRFVLGSILLATLIYVVWQVLSVGTRESVHNYPLVLSDSEVFTLPKVSRESDSFLVHHIVKRGETLGGIFSNLGLRSEDAVAVHSELEKIRKEKNLPSVLRTGRGLSIHLDSNGLFKTLQSAVSRDTEVFIKKGSDSTFLGVVEELPKSTQERVVMGAIESSFSPAARSAGLPFNAIDDLVDLFGDRVVFHRDFRKGDRFSVIFRDTILDDGTSLGQGNILAAALEVDSQLNVAVRYVGSDGVARYFDRDGDLLGSSFLRYPVKFSRISSTFSRSRFHPVLKRRRPHNGVDFAAPTGTPVRSVADGAIMFAGRKGGNGKMVKIRHTQRYSTAYLHLSRITSGLRRGRRVKRGQVIGAVGMTGLATGPHLHYSFYDRGKYVDPLAIKLPRVEKLKKGQKIDSAYLKRVMYTLRHYQNVEMNQAVLGG